MSSKNKKITNEDLNFLIENQMCEWISGEYKNSKSKLTIRFECGHIGEVVWNEFQQGKRCTACGIKQRSDSHRTKEIDVIEFLEEYNLRVIDFPNGIITQKESTVRYVCSEGHITERKIDKIFQYPTCYECKRKFLSEIHMRSSNKQWKGGTTELRDFCANQISEWKEESKKACGYKCVVTGQKMEEIHHLYPFGKMIYEALENLNLSVFEDMTFYSEREVESLLFEIKRLHSEYPLGVCLTKKVHKLFHKIYGRGDTTPEQFYDFIENIKNGNIEI